jgi:hypothetical protein
MNSNKQTTEEEKKMMAQFGITQEFKSVYFYEGHRYEKLSDAIGYARHNLAHTQTAVSGSAG